MISTNESLLSTDIQKSQSFYGHLSINTLYIEKHCAEVAFIDDLWHICMGHDGKEPLWEPAPDQVGVAKIVSSSFAGTIFVQEIGGAVDGYIIH